MDKNSIDTPPFPRSSLLLPSIGISAFVHLAVLCGLGVFFWNREFNQGRAVDPRPIAVKLVRTEANPAPVSHAKDGGIAGGAPEQAIPHKGQLKKVQGPKDLPGASRKKAPIAAGRLRGEEGKRRTAVISPPDAKGPRPPVKTREPESRTRSGPNPVRGLQTRAPWTKRPAPVRATGHPGRETGEGPYTPRKPGKGGNRVGRDPFKSGAAQAPAFIPARVLRLPKPAYPGFSRRRGEEGTVQVSLTVRENGKVDRVEVLRSSGYSRLDRAAVRAAEAASFSAATRVGAPVPSTKKIAFTFQLRDR